MSDPVLIILILCITYVVSMVIKKCDFIATRGGKYESNRKDGTKQ